MKKQQDNSVDLVFGSPPYPEKGIRYQGRLENRKTEEWVEWMLELTKEAVRISSGMVLWVVNGSVRNHRYLPACEGLLWKWYEQGGWSERSCIWHKNPLPNRLHWFVNAWEFVLAFKKPNTRSRFYWKSIAHPPLKKGTQSFQQRDTYGRRGIRKTCQPKRLVRPRDVLKIPVGGGLLGHPLAHENEAPFPLKLALHFVKACSQPGETVLDPFAGSGTTLQACMETGRKGIGLDVRDSQVKLAKRRIADVEKN